MTAESTTNEKLAIIPAKEVHVKENGKTSTMTVPDEQKVSTDTAKSNKASSSPSDACTIEDDKCLASVEEKTLSNDLQDVCNEQEMCQPTTKEGSVDASTEGQTEEQVTSGVGSTPEAKATTKENTKNNTNETSTKNNPKNTKIEDEEKKKDKVSPDRSVDSKSTSLVSKSTNKRLSPDPPEGAPESKRVETDCDIKGISEDIEKEKDNRESSVPK